MTYYHLPSQTLRSPGALETKLSDGKQLGVEGGRWTDELAALCGFVQVVEPAAPTPKANEVAESTVQLVNGVPTRVYTLRAKTADELAADTAQANRATIEGRATQALNDLDAMIAATGAPTRAEQRTTARILKALVRHQFSKLDSAD